MKSKMCFWGCIILLEEVPFDLECEVTHSIHSLSKILVPKCHSVENELFSKGNGSGYAPLYGHEIRKRDEQVGNTLPAHLFFGNLMNMAD